MNETIIFRYPDKSRISLDELRIKRPFKIYCIIGSSEDTMLLNAPYDFQSQRYTLINVITPTTKAITMYVRKVGGSLLEVKPFVNYPTEVTPGSIIIKSDNFKDCKLLTRFYRMGAMNDDIHRVMKAFGITEYQVPPLSNKFPHKTFKNEKWFNIPA